MSAVATTGTSTWSSAEILIPTKSSSNPGGVWHYTATKGWTLKNNGLPSGWEWTQIKASAFNPDHWLLLGTDDGEMVNSEYVYGGQYIYGGSGNEEGVIYARGTTLSPLWMTTDAGATWSEVALSVELSRNWRNVRVQALDWSETTPGRWWALGQYYDSWDVRYKGAG